MASELISIGLSVIDYLFRCEKLSGGRFGGATDHLVQGGGLAATAAVAMARLGGRVEMWSCIGDDLQGRFILEQFEHEGVDTSQVRVCRGGRSPACAVTVDRGTGERYFTYFAGGGLPRSPEGLALTRIDAAKAVLVDCTWPEAQLVAARRARERGVPVCADVSGVAERVRELLPFVDYPVYSEDCARRYGGTDDAEANLRKLAALGGKAPMVTLGSKGCIWLEDGQVRRLPAFKVEVVDTTGCGDVFHGAFTFGLSRGWGTARNARFASATAALKCRALGGRTGIPTYDEVAAFLERHP